MIAELFTTRNFEKLDIPVGRVMDVQPFPKERSSTHIRMIDFSPDIRIRKSLSKRAPDQSAFRNRNRHSSSC